MMAHRFYYGFPNIFSWLFSGTFTSSFIGIALTVLFVFGTWKMFEKAGEPGWAALIPFYNVYVLFKIGWGTGWLFLVLLIPFVGFVFYIILSIKLARAFGMGIGFGIGLILLPSIFYTILGLSDAKYYGPEN